MMTISDVMPAFLTACPSIGPAWENHLLFWGDVPDRGAFNDAAVVAHHIVDSFERGELSEFPSAFAVMEKCLSEGDEKVRNLIMTGIIEDIQNIASHREFGPLVFRQWLGSLSQVAWNEVIGWWERLAEAKAKGLLAPCPAHPSSPIVVPDKVQDANLRRMIEQMYRK